MNSSLFANKHIFLRDSKQTLRMWPPKKTIRWQVPDLSPALIKPSGTFGTLLDPWCFELTMVPRDPGDHRTSDDWGV